MRTLIVEDEFTSRMQIKYFLEEFGPCDIAVTGNEAISAYKMAMDARRPYDLICLDISLPDKSGAQALKEIRELEERMRHSIKSTVIIFMTTAKADPETVNDLLPLCNEYLLKPIDKIKLYERLRKHNLIG